MSHGDEGARASLTHTREVTIDPSSGLLGGEECATDRLNRPYTIWRVILFGISSVLSESEVRCLNRFFSAMDNTCLTTPQAEAAFMTTSPPLWATRRSSESLDSGKGTGRMRTSCSSASFSTRWRP